MINRTFMARVFAGAIACAFFALAPEAKSVGAVRMRLPGTACQTYGPPGISEVFIGETVPFLFESINGNEVVCPVPTGTDLVELHDTNQRKLSHVQVGFSLRDVREDEEFTLWAQDYQSEYGCICDRDALSANAPGFYGQDLHLNGDAQTPGCDTDCNGGPVPIDWTLSVHIWLQSFQAGGTTLLVHFLRVVDT